MRREKLDQYIGKKFNRLTILSVKRVEVSGDGKRPMAKVKCDCGTIKTIQLRYLKNGHTRSCGCLSSETTIALNKHTKSTHRKGRTTEYKTWSSMISRCHNKKDRQYPNYGGRGIQVCNRWRRFIPFLEDMGFKPSKSHSIDRINNNGNYEPSNCRWATPVEQCNNRRSSVFVEYNGERLTIGQLSRLTRINYYTLWSAYKRGKLSETYVESRI